MGRFMYGTPPTTVEFDDRVLAHLRVVIASKLRRTESFLFTWDYDVNAGSGSSTVWLHPAIAMQFDFRGSRQPRLNHLWLEDLVRSSNSIGGLRIVPEPDERTDKPADITAIGA